MSVLKNDRLLKAIWRQPVDATPIWIMRQAGRYLPEYRATRARAGSFMTLCKTPELACEVTLQPLDRYALDAAIIFSDILTIPDAMGLGLEFIEGRGPFFKQPLQNEQAIQQLRVPESHQLQYVYDAVRLVKRELNGRVPLIGFCGSPWTLAAYMVEGQSQPGFPKIQQLMRDNPSLLQQLLSTLSESVCAHLTGQIEAGADVVMIFDTWGGLLSEADYETFSLHYAKQIIAELKRRPLSQSIPVIFFTKGGARFLPVMSESGCDMLALDWEISLQEARATVNNRVALQGNLNPAVLSQPADVIREEVAKVLASYGHGEGHVFNLGHGITPDIPPEHVAILVDAVHEFSKPYHCR